MSSGTTQFSRRERQIMDLIHARGEAAASHIQEALPDAPSYSAVRALLRVLEGKGFLRHRQDGLRYVYLPTESRKKASRSALKNVLKTFFADSLANAVSAFVDPRNGKISPEELERLEAIIKEARNT